MQSICKMPCCLQEILPELYCGHDAFLFSSRYEAWGMPVLEAMAAGLAVVATACLGVDTFARHGINALVAPPQVPRCLPPPPPPPPPSPCLVIPAPSRATLRDHLFPTPPLRLLNCKGFHIAKFLCSCVVCCWQNEMAACGVKVEPTLFITLFIHMR